jgi:hypothetical protein
MVGFAHSLHIQSDLNPKIKLRPLDDMCTVYVRLRFLLTFAKLAPQAGFSTLKKIKFWSFPDYEIKYIHRFKLIYRVLLRIDLVTFQFVPCRNLMTTTSFDFSGFHFNLYLYRNLTKYHNCFDSFLHWLICSSINYLLWVIIILLEEHT